jgi:1-acyl-sn-glycerol-3-phosphate acyltransferase
LSASSRPDPSTSAELAGRLTRVEQAALALARFVNERPRVKALQQLYFKRVNANWVGYCTRNLLHVEGLERLQSLSPSRGVLLCANHRSFFDHYITAQIILKRVEWAHALLFPVRSHFFYDTWRGVLINALFGGMAMYPPIFRDAARLSHNAASLELLVRWLQRPGVVVGFHPEGTRGKSEDPYSLMPAQPGVGRLISRAHPITVPVFINGLRNDFATQMVSNFRAEQHRRPVIAVFGAPIDFGHLLQERPRPALYKQLAGRVMDELRALGERERELRAGLALARQ